MITVTPIYAGLLALLFIALSAYVIARRRSEHISYGDGEDKDLLKRIRVHANFAEYAPLGILLLLLAELQGAPSWILHGLGLMLIVGRFGHAIGMGATPQIWAGRFFGMILTYAMLGLTAISLIGHSVF